MTTKASQIRWVQSPHDPNIAVGIAPGTPIYDDELRHVAEPLGFSIFAWKPVRRRNGKWSWLSPVQRHDDGTYTKDRWGP